MLDALNYHVVDAKNASTALSMLRGVWIDILVISLPRDDPDGALFAGEAKTLQQMMEIVVESGRREEATVSGLIDAFVRKPFSLEQIDEAIKRIRATQGERTKALAQR